MKWKPFETGKKEIATFFDNRGEVRLEKNTVVIKDLLFEPSSFYPEARIDALDIMDFRFQYAPPAFRTNKEILFFPATMNDRMKEFAQQNNIPLYETFSNWELLLEPFLDTEFSDDIKERTVQNLYSRGIGPEEVQALRKEVSEQMYKYNFDTMLWEWVCLGLEDVLRAMRAKYSERQFHEFYWRAMEIELRVG